MQNYNAKSHRTDTVEGWHHQLNKHMGKYHFGTVQLVKFFKETKYGDFFSDRASMNMEGKRKTNNVIEKIERINKILSNSYSDTNITKLLKALSYT